MGVMVFWPVRLFARVGMQYICTIMSSTTANADHTDQSTAESGATTADLKSIVATLLTAQTQLDELEQSVAAARLDAVIEAVNVAIFEARDD